MDGRTRWTWYGWMMDRLGGMAVRAGGGKAGRGATGGRGGTARSSPAKGKGVDRFDFGAAFFFNSSFTLDDCLSFLLLMADC